MKIPDPALFYFSSINPNDQGMFEKGGNLFLFPVRVLTTVGREYQESTESIYEVLPMKERNMLESALFITCIPLSMVLGTIVKFFAYAIDPRMRGDEAGVRDFILMTDPPASPLQEAHVETLDCVKSILHLVVGVTKEEARQKLKSSDMERLFTMLDTNLKKESELLVKAFKEEKEDTWIDILKQNKSCPDHAKTHTSKFFFLTQIYFHMRNGTYYDAAGKKYLLENETRELFFKEGAPQNKLRLTFNKFMEDMEPICAKIKEDERFQTTLRLDVDEQQEPMEYTYPSTPIRWELIQEKEIGEILANKE